MAPLSSPAAPRVVLAVNSGSSSLKFGLYRVAGDAGEVLCEGEAQELGSPSGQFWFRVGAGEKQAERLNVPDAPQAFRQALQYLERAGQPKPEAVGHRMVHGGPHVRMHVQVDEQTLAKLRNAASFAPLHVPSALAVMEESRSRMPGVPQIACVDTAFHRDLPDVSKTLPISSKVRKLGVERYGFHGLSLESILRQLKPVPDRLIVAHLGGGCSVTAIQKGLSMDTSMGLTPTGGVMMGTRPGDLDPGVLLFLLRNGNAAVEELETLIDRHSGLLGVAEFSSDMRELVAAQDTDSRASLALRMFSQSVRKAIAGMAAVLDGVDLLVFTGGIGEHSQAWRDDVCRHLTFLGTFAIQVLESREDLEIALITARLIA